MRGYLLGVVGLLCVIMLGVFLWPDRAPISREWQQAGGAALRVNGYMVARERINEGEIAMPPHWLVPAIKRYPTVGRIWFRLAKRYEPAPPGHRWVVVEASAATAPSQSPPAFGCHLETREKATQYGHLTVRTHAPGRSRVQCAFPVQETHHPERITISVGNQSFPFPIR